MACRCHHDRGRWRSLASLNAFDGVKAFKLARSIGETVGVSKYHAWSPEYHLATPKVFLNGLLITSHSVFIKEDSSRHVQAAAAATTGDESLS